MIQVERLYHEIDLVRLKSIIHNWMKENSPIKSVTLYQNTEPLPQYIFVAELPPFPKERPKVRQEFRKEWRRLNPRLQPPEEDEYPRELNYTEEENAIIDVYEATEPDCSHLWEWLPQVYRNGPADDYKDQWMWFNILQGEELDEHFVREDTQCVLFGEGEEIFADIESSLIQQPPLSVEEYIEKRRSEEASKECIAFELYDKKGSYKMTHLQIGRILGMGNDLNDGQINTLKKRVERAIKKHLLRQE